MSRLDHLTDQDIDYMVGVVDAYRDICQTHLDDLVSEGIPSGTTDRRQTLESAVINASKLLNKLSHKEVPDAGRQPTEVNEAT